MNRFLDYVNVDPKTHLEKDKIYDFIEMKQVNPFARKPSIVVKRKYIGQGCVFKEGDILLARITPSLEHGKCVFIKKLDTKIGFGSTEFFVLRPRNNDIDRLYLYYFCFEPRFRKSLINSMVGASGRQRVNKDVFNEYEFDLPPFATQHKIASILSAYDNLIEVNERRIKILEEMARLIYKEWLVKFKFPGYEKVKMVKSELGMIPEGWEVKRLNEVVNTKYGYTESGSDEVVGPKFLRVKDINKNSWVDWSMVPYCKIEESKLKDYSLKKGDIVIARMADPGKVGIIEIDISAVFASYLIRLPPKTDGIQPYYLFYYLTSPIYQNFILGASTGTTRPSANAKVITDCDIVIPPREIVQKFETTISAIRGMLSVIIVQKANLRQTRDMLLPKLISGEIEVK